MPKLQGNSREQGEKKWRRTKGSFVGGTSSRSLLKNGRVRTLPPTSTIATAGTEIHVCQAHSFVANALAINTFQMQYLCVPQGAWLGPSGEVRMSHPTHRSERGLSHSQPFGIPWGVLNTLLPSATPKVQIALVWEYVHWVSRDSSPRCSIQGSEALGQVLQLPHWTTSPRKESWSYLDSTIGFLALFLTCLELMLFSALSIMRFPYLYTIENTLQDFFNGN